MVPTIMPEASVISLYMDDLKKIDKSGRLSSIYKSIPSQLALGKKKLVITAPTGKQKTSKDDERIFDLIDSKIVLPYYRVRNPNISLVQTMGLDTFKLCAWVAAQGSLTEPSV